MLKSRFAQARTSICSHSKLILFRFNFHFYIFCVFIITSGIELCPGREILGEIYRLIKSEILKIAVVVSLATPVPAVVTECVVYYYENNDLRPRCAAPLSEIQQQLSYLFTVQPNQLCF